MLVPYLDRGLISLSTRSSTETRGSTVEMVTSSLVILNSRVHLIRSCDAFRKSAGDDSAICDDFLISVRSPRRWEDLPQNTDLYIPLVEKE